MPARPLQVTQPGVLDGTGHAIVGIGPLTAREVWYPSNVHVSAIPANGIVVNQARCQVFVGPDTTQSNFRDTAAFGSTGDSTGACNADVVKAGWKIWAVWTGGDPGAPAILVVTGSKYV